MAGIDVGPDAVNRGYYTSAGNTGIALANAANASGYINHIEMYVNQALEGAKVGIFYLVSGTTYKCRSVATIGDVGSTGLQTFDAPGDFTAIAVEAGDFIGGIQTVGRTDMALTGGSGVAYINGEDHVIVDDSASYTVNGNYELSVYGEGYVFTQQSTGGGAITPTGTLGRNIKITIGSGSITPSGVLGRLIKIAVGAGAITPTGALASVMKFFQNVGSGAITPVGALGRKIKLAVGAGGITPSGVLGLLTKITVGGGAITPSGALGRLIKIAVGSGIITPASTLGRKIKIAVGGGAVAIAGGLANIYEYISLTLQSRSLVMTLQSRSLALTLKARSLAMTLISRSLAMTLKARSLIMTLISRG